jgi:hypothetical protein
MTHLVAIVRFSKKFQNRGNSHQTEKYRKFRLLLTTTQTRSICGILWYINCMHLIEMDFMDI